MIANHPGLLYVLATLLPLASFVILLLAGALRAAVRPYRDDPTCNALYRAMGGDTPVKTGAYVATTAIALAFVLSLFGLIVFKWEAPPHHEHGVHQTQRTEEKAIPAEEASGRWADHWTWAELHFGERPATELTLGYRIDSLSCIMFCMVTFIATLIHIFSIGYMHDELAPMVEDHHVHTESGHFRRRGRFGRFFLFLSLFCFSMLNLVLADNLFQVFLSWELVGVCSYLLIGFYYERKSASNAANKAFITNRIGDAGFILGLLILWSYVGTFNFEDIFRRIRTPENAALSSPVAAQGHKPHAIVRGEWHGAGQGKVDFRPAEEGSQVLLFPLEAKSADWWKAYQPMPYWMLVAAGLGIFLGCVGKSAQFPLHVWLPDAMEGPTPVSALIHAATMVAAGVYLVGRVFPLFTPEARLAIAYTGCITLFLAATIAIVMTDIKKVLAYSTVSQLGYMMLALGVGGWVAGLFHLVTHAFFKALLFLCSGSVIYGCHHEQDMLKMGGLFNKMRITAITMLIGSLTIAGTPLFSGWYSKDAILAQAFAFWHFHPKHFLLFLMPLATAGITAFYMSRMWFLTFTGKPRDHHVHEHAHESPPTMTVPLMILAVFSIIIAWGWPLYDAEKSVLQNHIEQSAPASVEVDFVGQETMASQSHGMAGNVALGLVILSIVFAGLVYYSGVLDPAEAKQQFPGLHRFLSNKWYFDELYSAILVRPALAVAHFCRAFDTYVIDGTVNALARVTVKVARWDGQFDLGVIDGLVNLTGRVFYSSGTWLRNVQTGYLRSYVLFLVLAAIGVFFLLSYVVTLALAG
jgi:NADH-quinone oxidoreductase subunit L